MTRDIALLFSTRIIRLFCYGFLSVVLALYLAEAGLTEAQIGLLFTLTLAGDALISLWLTTSADRWGRKRTLILGALLMAGAGLAFVLTRNVVLLVIAAILGVIHFWMIVKSDVFYPALFGMVLAGLLAYRLVNRRRGAAVERTTPAEAATPPS